MKHSGFVAYLLIVLFYPGQLFTMVSGRTLELGAAPVATLTAGLALLQYSVMRDVAPLYIRVGNAVALSFSAVILVLVLGGR